MLAGRISPITIFLTVFGRSVRVQCSDSRAARLLKTTYAAFLSPRAATVHFDCRIEPGTAGGFRYTRGKKQRAPRSAADLIFLFDKDLTVDLQRQRRDLFFVHAGVVAYRRKAIAFVAPSGTGKSTTVWALLRHGFPYISDELLPVDLTSGAVHPYPRSLCLKRPPPPPYTLPRQTLDTGGLLYVPTSVLKRRPVQTPLPLRTIFFLHRSAQRSEGPPLRRLHTAEAGAHLYANALNALAHPAAGLDGAIRIAAQADCYELELREIEATVDAIRALLRQRNNLAG